MSKSQSSSSSSSDSETEPGSLIPGLPDDVALNCLARVPRSDHPNLSLTSKPIHSLLSSPLFFSTRSLLRLTQPSLFLSLRPHAPHNSLLFFSLRRQKLLTPIPTIPSPSSPAASAYAALGHDIYVIGGFIDNVPSPHVWILDCRFGKWRPGPTMRVGREFAAAGVVDGRVYVMGGCVADNWARSEHWAEVLDPAVGRWEAVESPPEVRAKWMHGGAVLDGRVYAMADRGGVAYDARKRVWERVEGEIDLGWRGRVCVVKGVLYCYDCVGNIKWFDMERGLWKGLRIRGILGKKGGGSVGLPRFLCGAILGDFCGNLAVAWEEGSGKVIKIRFAEIEVMKDEGDEMWGEVVWMDDVLSVEKGSSIVHCSAVML